MYKGKVVQFFEGKKIISGLCLAEKGGKIHVLSEAGKEMNLTLHRILHISSYALDLQLSKKVLLEKIQRIHQKQKTLIEDVDSNDLWEFLIAEGECFDIQYLAQVVFGSTADSDHGAAILDALVQDRVHFKLHGRQFQVNSPEQVVMMQRKIESETLRQKEIEEAVLWLQSVMQGQEVPCTKREKFIELLKEFVLFGNEAYHYHKTCEILDQAKICDPKACFEILVALGIWDQDENLLLPRNRIAIQWPREVLRDAEVVAKNHPGFAQENKHREDLTHLQTFAIDDSLTKDIDDAISFEKDGEFFRLGIHISDVASFIMRDSPLDSEAARRGKSIYLPEGKISMLPSYLTEEVMSLQEGLKKPAVTLFVKLTPRGNILDFQIVLSLIKVTRKMTYQAVDSEIEGGSIFQNLYDVARSLKHERMASGALMLPIPELQVRVDEQKKIALTLREKETPSQIIVSECMILANHLAAVYCKEKKMPTLYRKQAEPRENIVLPDHPSIFHLLRQRKFLSRVEIGVDPGTHNGLGLNLYTSMTSPLRKYLDLVTQRQLLCLLAGNPPMYQKNELKNIAYTTEISLAKAAKVEQERTRYWVLKSLRDHIGEELKAVVLDKRLRGYGIFIKDYLLHANLTPPARTAIDPGETIGVILERVDPFLGTLKVKLSSGKPAL